MKEQAVNQRYIDQLKGWGFQAKEEWHKLAGRENRGKLKLEQVIYQKPVQRKGGR